MTTKLIYSRVLLILVFFSGTVFSGYSQVSLALKVDSNMSLKKADENGIVWLDAAENPFDLVGFEWFARDSVYRRLPVNPAWEITKNVDGLANHTAGGQLRFSTNSRKILVDVVLSGHSNMDHMPATGHSGFDLYIRDFGVQRYMKTTRFKFDATEYKYELYNSDKAEFHDFTINFPLYNGVKSLKIGVEAGSVVQAPPAFTFRGKIVIYGTSITQGGCVSRPGMAYSNILSRKLDARFVNLGFSGNGMGEPALAKLISQIDGLGLVILDYEANAHKKVKSTMDTFIDILREKHPDMPILVMSKIRYASEYPGSPRCEDYFDLRNYQRDLVKRRREAGDNNLYFLDGSKVLGDDYYECAVDGVHATDFGSERIANAMLKKIREIFK